MESLSSRYLHRKLSTGSNGFSAKNAYDDVFAGQPPKFGAQKISPARLEEDYKEIFGSFRASSIPILDLPGDNDTNGTADFRSSKLDYSNIFRGFRDEDGSFSYEELVANDRRIREKSSSGKFRTPSATGSPLPNSDRLSKDNKVFSSEASYQSFDDKKQFNMSYHKTSLGSKDGTNGTTHVAQFHPVPGFTCFVDETTPQKTEADKPNPSLKNDICGQVDFCEGVLEGRNAKKAMSNLYNKQTFGREVKSRSGFSGDGSYSNDKLFNSHDIDLKSHPSKVRPPSSMASNLKNSNGHSKRSTASNTEAPKNDVSEHAAGDCSPPFFGEELDVNSAAAASAAVLKNAIQKAQESIRIAKELMERRKEGSCSNRNFKDRLKVADRRENIIAHEGNRTEDNNAKDTCGSVDCVSQVFSGMGKKSSLRSGKVVPDFKDTERTLVAGKVIGDAHAKNLGAAEKCEPATWFSTLVNIGKNRTAISSIEQAVSKYKNVQSMDKHECSVKEMNIISETSKHQEVVVHKEKADEKANELEYMEKIPITVITEQKSEDNVGKLESDCVVHEHEEIEKSGISQDDEVNEDKQTGFYRNEECENKLESQQKLEDEMKFEAHKLMENDFEKRLDKAKELEEIENEQQEVSRQEHIEKTTKDVEKEEHELKLKRICDEEVDEERFEDAFQWVESENELKDAWGSERNESKEKDIHMGEDTESRPGEVHELKIDEKTAKDVLDGKESEELFEEFELEENEKGVTECYRYEETEYIHIEAEKIEVLQEDHYEDNYNKVNNVWIHNVSDNRSETRENCQREINDNSTKQCQDVDDNDRSIGATKDFYDFEVGEAEAVTLGYKLKEKETSRTACLVLGVADGETGKNVKVVFEVLPSEFSAPKFGSIDMCFGKTDFAERDKDNELDPNLDNGIEILSNGYTENEDIFEDNETTYDEEAGKSSLETCNGEWQYIEVMEDLETSHRHNVSREDEKTIQIDEEIRTRENTEQNEENFRKTITMEEKKTKIDEGIKTSQGKEVNEENPNKVFAMEEKEPRKAVPDGVEQKEYVRKIDEANKKDREREKDRIAVERAIREARERAFAGARERAERAAVERATAEVRHRVMAEARGKLEKASAATKSLAEKAFIEAKLRSERAAVERATAEARERALEKALSQKATSRAQAERFVAEKFSVPSSDNAMKKSLSSSDLLRSDETSTESAQRSKARLEKHERIMERAAKALAEKNMRDLLAQKEQAEKNRLSEALDADIKRWSSGKEGNLRALLSTLQYILGPGSGWQPISLTDIVTRSAVKKAYRKATLYVHPDKLQQRGASIQQKYICEKVFDLLKAAWNIFNSEER